MKFKLQRDNRNMVVSRYSVNETLKYFSYFFPRQLFE